MPFILALVQSSITCTQACRLPNNGQDCLTLVEMAVIGWNLIDGQANRLSRLTAVAAVRAAMRTPSASTLQSS